MTLLNNLERLARAATPGSYSRSLEYQLACSPERILQLVAVADACNGLLGLIQLVASRDDLPTGLDDVMLLSHRVTEARAVLAALEGDK